MERLSGDEKSGVPEVGGDVGIDRAVVGVRGDGTSRSRGYDSSDHRRSGAKRGRTSCPTWPKMARKMKAA